MSFEFQRLIMKKKFQTYYSDSDPAFEWKTNVPRYKSLLPDDNEAILET